MGLPDERFGLEPVKLCEVDPWAKMDDKGCGCSTPAGPSIDPSTASGAEMEALVQKLTDEIVAQLQKK
jgi:hypothetical protein